MAEQDWSSLTAALIPAGVGLAFGGRQRGAAAALGAAEGVGLAEKHRMDTEQFNADYRLRQQKLAQDQAQLEEQKARNVWLNRHIEDQMKTADQERALKADQHKMVMTDRAAADIYFKDRPPEERIRFNANPTAWAVDDMNQFSDQKKLETAGFIAASINGLVPKNVDPKDYVNSLGKKVFQEVVQNEQKQMGEMQQIGARTAGQLQVAGAQHKYRMAEQADEHKANRYDMVPLPDFSGFLKKDKQSGEMKIVTMAELGKDKPGMRDADRLKAEGELRRLYTTEMTNSLNKVSYEDWSQRPSSKAMRALMGRDISPDTYDTAMMGIQQRKITNYNAARENAKAAWASVNGRSLDNWQPKDDQDFMARLTTPEGNAALQRWIDYEEADPGKFVRAKPVAPGSAPKGKYSGMSNDELLNQLKK